MGELLECLEDLDLMSRRQGSTRQKRATREIDVGVSSGLEGATLNSSHFAYAASLARKDQVYLS